MPLSGAFQIHTQPVPSPLRLPRMYAAFGMPPLIPVAPLGTAPNQMRDGLLHFLSKVINILFSPCVVGVTGWLLYPG